jgi:hypothetical protein
VLQLLNIEPSLPSPRRVLCALVAGFLMTSLGMACTSVAFPVKYVRKHATAVFRGVIVEYRDSGDGYKIAVFQVSRVWKGHVGPVIELSTFPGYSDAPCGSFSTTLREVGTELLVFANKGKGQHYLIGYWSGTRAPLDEDLHELGPGTPPSSSH